MGAHLVQPVDDALVIEKAQGQLGQVARRTHERRQFQTVDGDTGQRLVDHQAVDQLSIVAVEANVVCRACPDKIKYFLCHSYDVTFVDEVNKKWLRI